MSCADPCAWTLSHRELARQARRRAAAPDLGSFRPKQRGECSSEMRPCPWVRCRHHLFLEAKPSGSLKFPHGADTEALLRMKDTCSLDVAARGALSLGQVGDHLNLTHERVRQEEEIALSKLRPTCEVLDLHPGSDPAESEYIASPQDDHLEALGLQEEASWIKKLWSQTATTEKKP